MVAALVVLLALGHARSDLAALLFIAPAVLAVEVICVRVLKLREDRLPWLLLAGFVALLAFDRAVVHFGDAGGSTVAGGAVVAAYAIGLGGLAGLLARLRPWKPALSLDGALLALAVAAGLLALAGDGLRGDVGDLGLVAPLGGDLLMLCLVGLALGQTSWRPPPAWWAVGGVVVALLVADTLVAVDGRTIELVATPLYPLAFAALALAAWQPPRAGSDDGDLRLHSPVAVVATLIALAVLVVAATIDRSMPAAGIAAAVCLLLALLRGMLGMAHDTRLLDDAREDSVTDTLTGLGNRRRLLVELERALRAAHRRPLTLLFFDLDGFKGYNDTFGHAAGDALLARLGAALRSAVGPDGDAYRLGGDEFCVLLAGRHAPGSIPVERARRALTEHGDGFTVGATLGLVVLPDEATEVSKALQLADRRMYAGKRGQPRARTQAGERDLLLALLPNGLQHHEGSDADIVALALGVGRRLGMGIGELELLARAAELHDIGKVAVPDSILDKPGPLADDEWSIVRRHTIIGERIVAATQELRPVADLVRSSHERWDGHGYPDGRLGSQTPLAARIVAVCNAYSAMRADRNYASAVSEEAALAELRRNAGSQFDPTVVTALEDEVRSLPQPVR